jgi:hypothetical protein
MTSYLTSTNSALTRHRTYFITYYVAPPRSIIYLGQVHRDTHNQLLEAGDQEPQRHGSKFEAPALY